MQSPFIEQDGKLWLCPDCNKPSVSRYGDTTMGDGLWCGKCYFRRRRKQQEEYDKEHSGIPSSRTELRALILDVVSFIREYHAELEGFDEVESALLAKYEL